MCATPDVGVPWEPSGFRPGDRDNREEVIQMTTETIIADIEPQGRQLSESELAAVLGGVGAAAAPLILTSTGGSCGGCH
jgi:hypothetical protein